MDTLCLWRQVAVFAIAHQHITSVLCWPLAAGHSRRAGSAITLAELLLAIGSTHSLMDIYFWYDHAQLLVWH